MHFLFVKKKNEIVNLTILLVKKINILYTFQYGGVNKWITNIS